MIKMKNSHFTVNKQSPKDICLHSNEKYNGDLSF